MAKTKLKVAVTISWYVHELIKKLHKKYPHKERSGIAKVERIDGWYMVTDIRFPKQSNSWGETEMKDWWLSELLEDIFNKTPSELDKRKCWIHSHHSMWCFRSGTDETAKRSFNDWATSSRLSIVTAYTSTAITYKCALNVFDPIDKEYNLPILTEEFDLDQYTQAYGISKDNYIKEYDNLSTRYDSEVNKLEQPYTPDQIDVDKLLDIFNLESTDDNVEIVTELLVKERGKTKATKKNKLIDNFNAQADSLNDEFLWQFFTDKLKELEDNIIVNLYPGVQKSWVIIHHPGWISNRLFDDFPDDGYVPHKPTPYWEYLSFWPE